MKNVLLFYVLTLVIFLIVNLTFVLITFPRVFNSESQNEKTDNSQNFPVQTQEGFNTLEEDQVNNKENTFLDLKIRLIPESGFVSEDRVLYVQGQSIAEVDIFIGNFFTSTDEFGDFILSISLVDGENILPLSIFKNGNKIHESEIVYYLAPNLNQI